MSNVVKLYVESDEYEKEILLNARKAVKDIWEDEDVRQALKEKVLEHINNMSSFDMTYETGFKNRVMPSIFSDELIQKTLKSKFIGYLEQDDINYDLGEALYHVLTKILIKT